VDLLSVKKEVDMTQYEVPSAVSGSQAPVYVEEQPVTTMNPAWHAAVAAVAEKARATLPSSTGRIEKAVALVLTGAVEILPDRQTGQGPSGVADPTP
jgi:hypothetical protein